MEKEDQLKEAFQKIKQDIDYLKKENNLFENAIIETREKMSEIIELIKQLAEVNSNLLKILEELKQDKKQLYSPNRPIFQIEGIPAHQQIIPAHQQIIPAHQQIIPAHPADISSLKGQILDISTGNERVPTDRQTDQQTNKSINKGSHNKENSIENAYNLLDSLDTLKKEIRLKFKKLTDQELLIFSTIYQLEEEHGFADYKSISDKLNLTESSIRDYVGRLLKKEIPLEKSKINNKNIRLSISKNLKKIASLQTILHLKDI
ncbi:MAG: hypothetical protein WC584_00395 [Candidatus Pacearchaeota archaeon]